MRLRPGPDAALKSRLTHVDVQYLLGISAVSELMSYQLLDP
jgi:hypothetical protein